MTKRIFEPVVFTLIPASAEHHGENTAYKVAVGFERNHQGVLHLVQKIQLTYNGNVDGRIDPSFVPGEFDIITRAMTQVWEAFKALDDPMVRDLEIPFQSEEATRNYDIPLSSFDDSNFADAEIDDTIQMQKNEFIASIFEDPIMVVETPNGYAPLRDEDAIRLAILQTVHSEINVPVVIINEDELSGL